MDCTDDKTPSDLISKNLAMVNEKLRLAYGRCISEGIQKDISCSKPRLVAATKTKPVELILKAYNEGQKHFGENYVHELIEKSQDPKLAGLDICWHFIGHLQRNKCNNLVACSNLWGVETLDSERLASTLDASWGRKKSQSKLNVFVQVNTSEEASKSGCQVQTTPSLVRYILDHCDHLMFCGLMTIGSSGHDYAAGPNPDFECLVALRRKVCEECGVEVSTIELSMGMSSDYEEAIYAGSTNVRVGSLIFGPR